MAERFRVLIVGRARGGWAEDAVADYSRRLQRMGGIVEESVKAEAFRGDIEAVRSAEAERLLARTGPRDRLVALDERGESPDSLAFSALVDEGRRDGTLVFAIGGPYGHGEELRRRAWRTVRLSSLVLNHEVARVVLYEQLYRAMTLITGIPYHH